MFPAERSDLAFHRVRRLDQLPPPENRSIDIAVLDMNHGFPNLGHDCVVRSVEQVASAIRPQLDAAGLAIRVFSFDVRRTHAIPSHGDGRFHLYLATGGPGHLDPALNDGVSSYAQGVSENPGWLPPLFRLFDAVYQDEVSALFGVCHSFGMLCLWSGIAQPVLRGQDKGGKSTGIVDNRLTAAGAGHPWFSNLSTHHEHFKVVDSRLFDLIPAGIGHHVLSTEAAPDGITPAVTMVEFARSADGRFPRMFAVNHHPEIREPGAQKEILDRKLAAGEVTADWYRERLVTVVEGLGRSEHRTAVQRTSRVTWTLPIQSHLQRLVQLRSAVHVGFQAIEV